MEGMDRLRSLELRYQAHLEKFLTFVILGATGFISQVQLAAPTRRGECTTFGCSPTSKSRDRRSSDLHDSVFRPCRELDLGFRPLGAVMTGLSDRKWSMRSRREVQARRRGGRRPADRRRYLGW